MVDQFLGFFLRNARNVTIAEFHSKERTRFSGVYGLWDVILDTSLQDLKFEMETFLQRLYSHTV